MNNSFDLTSAAEACIKCGKCIPTCTIHQVNADETTTPRGFLHLLGAVQEGDLELDKNAKDIFESCFLCTNCTDVCPASLPTDWMIEKARIRIAAKYGIAWWKRLFFALLKRRGVMDFLARVGYVVKTCAFKTDPKKGGMLARFGLPMVKKNRLLPSPAAKSFLNTYPEEMNFGGDRKVAIFIGCLANYVYTEIGDSLLYILKKLGINAYIPKDQLCCGAPAWFTGDEKSVKWLIKYNIEYFELFIDNVEAILVPEATCSSMMIHDWLRVLEDEPEWQERAKKITTKTHIATAWLFDHTDLQTRVSSVTENATRVTYHDPCHARKTQGVFKEPRALLQKGYELIEMSDPNRCCGFGGVTIQSEKFHLAQAAGVPKAQMIAQTKAEVVSAECSACRIQLSEALNAADVDCRFNHPLELIALNLKAASSAPEEPLTEEKPSDA